MKSSTEFLSGRSGVVFGWGKGSVVKWNRKFLALVFIGCGLSLFDHLIFGGPTPLPSIK